MNPASWSFLAFTLLALLTACSGPKGLPEIAATTTISVQNRKAQPAHDSQIRQLDSAQLDVFFSGKKISGRSPDGLEWQASFDASGMASFDWDGPDGKGSDIGSWKIDSNANCVNWQTLIGGEQNCMTLYRVDKNQYNLFNDNGSFNSMIIVPASGQGLRARGPL